LTTVLDVCQPRSMSTFTVYAGLMDIKDFDDLDLAEEYADQFSDASVWNNETDVCVWST